MVERDFNPLTLVYFQCHDAVNEIIKQETGRYPGKYKNFERRKIDKLFETISYKAINKLEFAAETMSGLIVLHGLPNTNHRSTITFISYVLRTLDVRFPDYEIKKNRKKWIDECNRYIQKSKRILYRRKHDRDYKEKHLAWTKEWLEGIIGNQSNSLGMMSRKSLITLRKISSSLDLSSAIVKK